MSSTLNLKLWSNFNRQRLSQLINVGDSWIIDPNGPILEPADYADATSAPGVLKAYRDVHPDSLIIHWLFPNIHVGHILWVSRAPLQLTKAQIATVRRIEKQLAMDWERVTRWDFTMLTPPPFRCSLGPREIHSFQRSPHHLPWSQSGRRSRAAFARDHRSLRQAA